MSIVIGFVLLCLKWGAYLATGSQAILSDALESIVHIGATSFAFLGVQWNERPPDRRYPYGYGKISYFSAGFEGGLICLAGVTVLHVSIQSFIRGSVPRGIEIGIVLVAIAGVVNLVLGTALTRLGNETNSIILVADGRHVLSDAITSVGVILGISLVWITGYAWLDGAVAILMALLLLKSGYDLVRESYSGLMDRADVTLLATIVETLRERREEEWSNLHQLRAWRSGDRTFVDFHLDVPEQWTVKRIHECLDKIRRDLREVLGAETDVVIHFDPSTRIRREVGASWTVESAVRTPEPSTEYDIAPPVASA